MKKSGSKNKVVPFKKKTQENTKVISMISKLEKRTEKQMSNFVKEIVVLKKEQAKLAEKLKKAKLTTTKTSKKISKTPKKKKNTHLKIVKTNT